jgi:PIN domain nuclease of toxin-antitoxin system
MAEIFLLDTHTVVWTALAPEELSHRARSVIEDDGNKILFSPVTAMEIATKVRIGKFELARPLARGFSGQMTARRFFELPLTSEHAELAGSFSSPNNDPWDRLLAAQSQIERATLITCDGKMDGFGIKTLW